MSDLSVTTAEIQVRLDRLYSGDSAAMEELFELAGKRLERLARKMLGQKPWVARWAQTGDVLQNATIRLCRALEAKAPRTAKDFFSLAAVKIRQELIDLGRHYCGPHGVGAHHESGAVRFGPGFEGDGQSPRDDTFDPVRLAAWTEFHEKIDELTAEEREVFHLHWYQDLPLVEVAANLGVPAHMVRSLWRSARLHLLELLDNRLPE